MNYFLFEEEGRIPERVRFAILGYRGEDHALDVAVAPILAMLGKDN
ncbi:hypothetical protein [Paenibacillus sp. UMB7766-LJ446]|nr:hypothetical protein [Paenibacillus sp. UMB7766-LJ446]